MAVIVSDSRNASYDGNLSTVNGFYRGEAWNLGAHNQTAVLATSTRRPIDVTFANAGNCQGLGLLIRSANGGIDRNILVQLLEAKAVSSFNVSTERVNITGHGFSDGQQVAFSSTGTLPTGITLNVTYYVINATANDFQISTTSGGSVQALSGTPTGTATCWAVRADTTMTSTDVMGTFPTDTDMTVYEKYSYGMSFVPFKFATPYAVDTSASKWRFLVFQTDGTKGTWDLATSDGTNPFYFTWCDTAISHTDGDVMIVVDKVTIDKSFTITGVLGTGDTVNSTAGVICRSEDLAIPMLEWENPAAASYTMTIKGDLLMGTHSIFHAGTVASPIATAQAGTIYFDAPAVGTVATSRIYYPTAASSTSSLAGIKQSISIVGEVPAVPATTLSYDAVIGQPNIVTTDNTGWSIGDDVVIGKQDVMGQGSTILHRIQSISGTNITLTANLATANRINGGTVVRFNGYGMNITAVSNTNYGRIVTYAASNLTIKGCNVTDVRVENVVGNYYYMMDAAANRSKLSITDNVARYTGTTNYGFVQAMYIPKQGAEVLRNYTFRGNIIASISGYANRNTKSGYIEIKNNVCISNYQQFNFSPLQTATKLDIQDNKLENSARYGGSITGLNIIFKNNIFWGITATPASLYPTMNYGTLINPQEISGNIYNRCGLVIYLAGTILNARDIASSFGQESPNTVDILPGAGAIIDYTFDSPIGALVIDDQYMTDVVAGSEMKIKNYDSTQNSDSVYTPYGYFYRTGYALADTTVWTGSTFGAASPDQFALRMRSNGTELLEYEQSKTLGSILGLTMTVSCRIKINTAAYYAGVHTLPTLRVIYDNGTEITDVATATTDPQQLLVSFIPTTDAASIRVIIETLTDAVDTDADVYVGQVLIPPPEGTSVDTQNLGSWVDAMPLPSVSTIPAPGTPWNEAASAYTVAGTMGKKLNDGLTTGKFLALK